MHQGMAVRLPNAAATGGQVDGMKTHLVPYFQLLMAMATSAVH